VTRDELEVVIWRELSTLVSAADAVSTILAAADEYALTECETTLRVAS
jgi:hypothetical protein